MELAYNPLILLPLSDINLKMGISGKRNRRVHRTGNKQEQRQNEKQAECKKQNYINGKNSTWRERKWMGIWDRLCNFDIHVSWHIALWENPRYFTAVE